MLESMSSKAVFTKVKAMYGHMLTMADYEQLMHKTNVPACAAYLKSQTYYADVLHDVQETQIHRGALEALLTKAIFEQLVRLAHYVGHADRFFHSYHVMRLEIQSILNCVRLFDSGFVNEFMQSIPGYAVSSFSFDVLALDAVDSYDKLMEALRKTPYAKVLEPLRTEPGSTDLSPSLQRIEHALYGYYYAYCHKLVDLQYHGQTARELHNVLAMQAQLFNIRAIYRLKRFFGTPPETILGQRLDITGKGPLPQHIVEQVVKAPDADAMLEILSHTRIGKYFNKADFSFIEYSSSYICFDLAKKHLTFSQNPTTVFIAFTMLREIEVENLLSVIEGIRYGLDSSQIRPLLIYGGA